MKTNLKLSLIAIFLSIAISSYSQKNRIINKAIPPITVHIQTAGTLSEIIAPSKKYLITDLTIIGNLNGSDILYIREMSGVESLGEYSTKGKLTKLDLSKANIINGGNTYFRDNYFAKNYYTENDIISSYMFSNLGKMTSIILPDNIISIDERAFYGCSRLTSITIPQSVTSIGKEAFTGCYKLKSIKIPSNVISIGEGAFSFCDKIKEFTVSEENPKYMSDDGVLFNKDKTSIIAYPIAKLNTTYVIPNGVISICASAFEGANLSYISIPNSVTSIGSYAFASSSLNSINIPDNVTSINDCTFYNCYSLTSLSIGNKVTSIGEDLFHVCDKLTSITIKCTIPPKTNTDTFKPINKNTCKLYVPKGSYGSYWGAAGWDDFKNIIEKQ